MKSISTEPVVCPWWDRFKPLEKRLLTHKMHNIYHLCLSHKNLRTSVLECPPVFLLGWISSAKNLSSGKLSKNFCPSKGVSQEILYLYVNPHFVLNLYPYQNINHTGLVLFKWNPRQQLFWAQAHSSMDSITIDTGCGLEKVLNTFLCHIKIYQ